MINQEMDFFTRDMFFFSNRRKKLKKGSVFAGSNGVTCILTDEFLYKLALSYEYAVIIF